MKVYCAGFFVFSLGVVVLNLSSKEYFWAVVQMGLATYWGLKLKEEWNE